MADFTFAAFSDVHANLPALKAVLDDIEQYKVDACYCLGDLVDFAPWPNETIALLRQRNIPVVLGNHDRRVADNEPVPPLPWHSQAEREARLEAITLSQRTLSEENRRWLQDLPTSQRLNLGPRHAPLRILLVHASPRSLSEYLTEEVSDEQLLAYQQQYHFDVLISGHTHRAGVRTVAAAQGQCIIANAGATGRIKPGQPQASWLAGRYQRGKLSFEIGCVRYDVAGTAQAIRESAVPDFYADELMRNGMPGTFALGGG
ncbi:putative phosphodiesterase [Raoultella sp. BIGb0149]|uniref:metallophosphoesterase family protein n=1 Tax=Raoultella sp. BIGb0149 TaxID=2485116 RepID=UPI00105F3F73|nr:metallophosphoesterase [Raoultella sp. BIGb0149]TDQ24758.1 putative phosphodiesterase [Raoultella sp. BIGb0149]